MKCNKFKYIIPVLLLALGLTSCVGDLDVNPNINPQLETKFVQNEVFSKVYANLGLTGQQGPSGKPDVDAGDEGTSGLVRLIWNLQELPTDEAVCSWGDGGLTSLNNATWGAGNEFVRYMYYRLNFGITVANWFLEKTEGDTSDSTQVQRAEVRFLRALHYYYMMDLYGNVPFATTVNTTSKPVQISRDSVFSFVESELLAIEPTLKDPLTNTYGRVDKAADWLLLSRLYLNAEVYTGTPRWADAATYSRKVVNSGYKLAPNYAQLFMADNGGTNDGSTVNTARQEVILPILQDGFKTVSYAGSTFLIASTHNSDMPAYGLTAAWSGNRARSALIQKFFGSTEIPQGDPDAIVAAANDSRALFFSTKRTQEIADEGIFLQGISVAKWSNIRADGKSISQNSSYADTDVPFMRAAEAYLNLAEAIYRQKGGFDNEALAAIDSIRSRAGAKLKTTYTLSDLLDERAREFYFEGYRRTDLIRFGMFGGFNASYVWDWKGGSADGANFAAYRNIYPIPTNELNTNSNMKQNPGY